MTGLNIEVSSKALKPEGDTLEGMVETCVLVGRCLGGRDRSGVDTNARGDSSYFTVMLVT